MVRIVSGTQSGLRLVLSEQACWHYFLTKGPCAACTGGEEMHGAGASPPKVPRLDLKGAGLTKHSTRPLPPHVLAGTRDMYIYEWLNDSCRDDSFSDTLATSTRFTEGPCDWASAADGHSLTSPTSGQSYVTARHHMPAITTQVCLMDIWTLLSACTLVT